MKNYEGYLKQKLGNDYVLLAGGSHKALDDFAMSNHTHDYVNKFSYSLPANKVVRITYSAYNGCFISACRSNGGGQAIWVGTGYGEEGWVRNQWRCLINSNTFKYSLPNTSSVECSIEIFHDVPSNYNAATINVWCSGNVTFTELNTLTTPAEDATMIYAGNWSTYINLTTLGAAAAGHSHTITIGDSQKSFSTSNVSWSLSDIGAAAATHYHSYTDLRGSSTTANQAIVSSGTADGWTLKTLGSMAWDSGSYVTTNTTQSITGQKKFNTSTNTIPVIISRSGEISESLSIGVDDTCAYFVHQQDETVADFIFRGYVTDTEHPSGRSATKNIQFALGYNRAAIYIDGATVYHTDNLKTMVASGSSHSGGLVPDTPATAGTAKFLREDGSWAVPSYTTNTNTTYTISTGDNNGQIKITPSSGNAYNVDVKGLGTNAFNSDVFVKRHYSSIEPSKGLRISYDSQTPVLIHAGRSNGGSQLILLGSGYGEAGWVRNSWVCLQDTSMFYWSLPGDNSGYSQAIEIFHNSNQGNGSVTVWSSGSISFTKINSLTATRDTSHSIITTGNWNSYITLASLGANYLSPTSSNRPGVTRLYRYDHDSNYSVRTDWTGTYWRLRGFYEDGYHAGCQVAYAESAGSITWGNVTSKPSSTGSGTQPVYWNGSTFVACTTYANASVNYADSAGSAGSAGYITGFRVSSYSVPEGSGVRISYPGYVPVLISAQRSNSGGRLILIGGGYGSGNWVRNDFQELVSSGYYTWCIGDTLCVEIMGGGTVTVWTSSSVTFTSISALSRSADNRRIIINKGDQTISGNLTATNFYTSSDINKKTNFAAIPEKELSFTQFTWKKNGIKSYGLIAQQVKDLYPELVDGEDGNMTVNYSAALCLTVGQLQRKVKDLEEKVRQLENLNK